MILNADIIERHPFMSLEDTIKWKQFLHRSKDLLVNGWLHNKFKKIVIVLMCCIIPLILLLGNLNLIFDNNKPKFNGLLLVITAPSGTGKTTLIEMLLKEFPYLKQTVSCTTRSPRTNEINGKHYYFLSASEFKTKIASGEFFDYTKLWGVYYGILRKEILDNLNKGNSVVTIMDAKGAMKLKKMLHAVYIFIAPPSLNELSTRLNNRKTENKDDINKRLHAAKSDLKFIKYYDYNFVNDDLATAYQTLRAILIIEENKHRGLSTVNHSSLKERVFLP